MKEMLVSVVVRILDIFASAPGTWFARRSPAYRSFLKQLSETPHEWHVFEADGALFLRARKPRGSCPLTEVCKVLSGRRYKIDYWTFAAEEIGLPIYIGKRIVHAADGDGSTYSPSVRRDLLAATGARMESDWDAALAGLIAEASPSGIAGEVAPSEPAEPETAAVAG